MTAAVAARALTGGVALLERAMGYTLGGLVLVTPDALSRPTPCRRWDLRDLLLHMNDSLQTLHEAIEIGHLELAPGSRSDDDFGDPAGDPVASLRNRACRMIGAWAGPDGPSDVTVADRRLAAGLVAAAGAVEVAVHGWDVSQACGESRVIPAALAEELYELCLLLVDDADRPHRFAPPVDPPGGAVAGDRLVALLGRRP
jgi:uncharacterized protein (TIGR03086 family)